MRRGVGVGRSMAQQRASTAFKEKAEELQESNVEHAKRSVEAFRGHLEAFAAKHKDQIASDPEFRSAFAAMCASIGIDPLASQKGFWAELLGVGDFYFQLGVQIVTVAMATKPVNGGVMSIDDLLERLLKIRQARGIDKKKQGSISRNDVLNAISKLTVLGNGFQVGRIGDREFLFAVPIELSSDQTIVLGLAKDGRITQVQLEQTQRWTRERSERALNALIHAGIAWWDKVDDSYYFPSTMPHLDFRGLA